MGQKQGCKDMRVAVIGGKLQGVEAAYLAHKAGWEVVLIDRDPVAPAVGLCDAFRRFDVTGEHELVRVLSDVQFIIPALENGRALASLHRWATHEGIPIAFDADAYAISSSKIKSDKLFASIGVPAPLTWPDCGFPAVSKPSEGSGSKGVFKIESLKDLQAFTDHTGLQNGWVIQEFLKGPSFSLEVLGFPGGCQALQITEIEVDDHYDCKRVLTPAYLSEYMKCQFGKTSTKIAESLKLFGIMDVEAILHDQKMKVLEIDARLPSQTPTAVYLSTGINMVEILGEIFVQSRKPAPFRIQEQKGVVYEHIKVSPGTLEVSGERIMASAGPLHVCRDFFSADEAITDYSPGSTHWVATLIVTGKNREEAWAKRCEAVRLIRKRFGLYTYTDPSPPT